MNFNAKMARATVLMYHRLSDSVVLEDEAFYTVSPARFEEQMRAIRAAGYRVARAEELGRAEVPERAVVVTFDDGSSSDFALALPVLLSLGLTAAFFVNPARVGQKHFMSWEQIAALASAGMSIGSHGLDHRLLDGLAAAELERQLADSKAMLEERLGVPVALLSLPGGSGEKAAPALARRLGYKMVFGSVPAPVEGGEEVIPRFAIRRHETAASVLTLVRHRPVRLAWERARHRALRTARALSGNLYQRVRGHLFSRAARGLERT